jgi:pimeloyl-ACP methyl ester carboxylesterase
MASEMVNGALLHYEERGDGPPLLLVHGTGSYAGIRPKSLLESPELEDFYW